MASTIKVDNVQNQPGTNIVSKCGTDVTLGASGDTVALACGASQTGFGKTGTVDWVTTPKVTGDSPVTAATGSGYFLNTTAGTITVNLPAGAAGSIVSMSDYAGTWQTNNVTVAPNGSEKIGSVNATVALNIQGQSVTFIYIDSTQGWLATQVSVTNIRANQFIVACGGNATLTCGDYKMHVFTGPGTFCVSAGAGPVAAADYMIMGGGAGGGAQGGGGGAGGYRESPGSSTCYTASPLGAAPMTSESITVQGYAVVIGGGGSGSDSVCSQGTAGSVSSVFGCTSAGGGGGGSDGPKAGADGGSGGGGGHSVCGTGGTGNTPPTTPSQGFDGGIGRAPPSGAHGGGGGGGGGAVGAVGTASVGGDGGIGSYTQILGSTPTAPSYGEGGPETGRYFTGGGGGTANPGYSGGDGGIGGGGNGASPSGTVTNGTINTGSGGGSKHGPYPGTTNGAGGSGIVIIRYKFQ